eukprot:CAMPEP_0201641110 /NCGR_PEP_ID=MMETSP0493-20130528/23363_1 /ASSEMBLY_ACC=CAM_ASM_000838 /TAXON_ID=420259 /ORGANISM="Thalassiosira gravida, Strain GMp14c1" /LENGTH=43 /DNA_ID= /DNA_START= /DNA_END= /DNA_ORIENTATION=
MGFILLDDDDNDTTLDLAFVFDTTSTPGDGSAILVEVFLLPRV